MAGLLHHFCILLCRVVDPYSLFSNAYANALFLDSFVSSEPGTSRSFLLGSIVSSEPGIYCFKRICQSPAMSVASTVEGTPCGPVAPSVMASSYTYAAPKHLDWLTGPCLRRQECCPSRLGPPRPLLRRARALPAGKRSCSAQLCRLVEPVFVTGLFSSQELDLLG